jgi:hypothetical protein
MLARSHWAGTGLRQLVGDLLAPYRFADELGARIDGPDLILEPNAARSMALVVPT